MNCGAYLALSAIIRGLIKITNCHKPVKKTSLLTKLAYD